MASASGKAKHKQMWNEEKKEKEEEEEEGDITKK